MKPFLAGARPYACSLAIFSRVLGLVYAAAFLSLLPQIHGLIGSEGILPLHPFLQAVNRQEGMASFWKLPTLFWFNASDAFITVVCWAGIAASALLVLRILPLPAAVFCWVLYLSLVQAGQEFLSFQWDILLLEAGFLAVFMQPWLRQKPGLTFRQKAALYLAWWLLFRLMISSGAVKLLSGDPAWRQLTALTFHYETTPLPVWAGWWLHQAPLVFHQISCALLFFIELAVPFLIFFGRIARRWAAGFLIILQAALILSGNFAFFNWLTIALCLLLLDDACFRMGKKQAEEAAAEPVTWKSFSAAPFLLFAGLISLVPFCATLRIPVPWPEPVKEIRRFVIPFYLANHYGLFAVMTQLRPEIILEGSQDGETWHEYRFKWKPGDLKQWPAYVAPHQPRLDWQMWFAALGSYQRNPWFISFMRAVMAEKGDVLRLLEEVPFEGHPRYLRAVRYLYEFTSREEYVSTGQVWTRKPLGLYAPVLARSGGSLYWTGEKPAG